MSHAFVMLVALSGLGCENKPGEPSDPQAAPSPAAASPAQEAAPAAASPAQDAAGGTSTPAVEAPAAIPTAPPVTTPLSASPPPYPRFYPETFPDVEDLYSTHAGRMYATFYSFVWGKDPGIPSASEIEASALGNGNPH
jgi:hypothetical protein